MKEANSASAYQYLPNEMNEKSLTSSTVVLSSDNHTNSFVFLPKGEFLNLEFN